ncbi:hypothetical protein K3495_g7741 [Podosphaera aphanis]|nr:hypothetical protein K3495_g7741 [Podosphaera aphanis]
METLETASMSNDNSLTSNTKLLDTQKCPQEEDNLPTNTTSLNTDLKPSKPPEEPLPTQRVPRIKKESLKKREAKGTSNGDLSSRASPDGLSSKSKKKTNFVEIGPLRYKLATFPTLTDFKPPQAPGFNPVEKKLAPDGTEIQFNETFDHAFNKKSFNYTSAVPDPIFRHSLYFRQSECPPYTARFSLEDSASNILVDQECKHITTEKGWRSAKANVCMREGRWYWECKITCGIPQLESTSTASTPGPHVRMGIGRREATLEGPVGFDCYSYGLRDVGGQKIHMSRPKDFFENNEHIREGDVIGFEVNLPSENLHRKIVNGTFNPRVDVEDQGNTSLHRADIIRDRAAIKIKDYWVFEQAAYAPGKELEDWYSPAPTSFKHDMKPCPSHPSIPLRTLPHSSITIYKNGVLEGTAFDNLFSFLPPASKPAVVKDMFFREGLDDGTLGYYPTISVFQGGAAEVNFGPNYWFPPTEIKQIEDEVDMIGSDQPAMSHKLKKIRPLTERYEEQIVEDVLADLVDEVYFWVLDDGSTVTDNKNQVHYNGIQLPNNGSGDRMELS